MKKTAFTLGELLIVMALMGALAIILLPNTKTLVPNQSLTMFKKAFSVTTQTVNNLLSDEDLYPEKDDGVTYATNLQNTDDAIYRTEVRSGNNKFCYLFAEMLNVTSNIDCETQKDKFTDGTLPAGNFITSDGIVWILPITNFDDKDKYEIYVDVNGDNKPNQFVGKNCKGTNSDGSSECRGIDPDRFIITLTKDGKLGTPTNDTSIEKFYLKSENSSAKYYKGKEKK